MFTISLTIYEIFANLRKFGLEKMKFKVNEKKIELASSTGNIFSCLGTVGLC